jgi:hypothetical protein
MQWQRVRPVKIFQLERKMQRKQFERNFFEAFRDSTISNYVVPGLESVSLGRLNGFHVRMFHMTMNQMMYITPHSHRFDLLSFVLEGEVEHHVYESRGAEYENQPSAYKLAILYQEGKLGKYETEIYSNGLFRRCETVYKAGDSYFLNAAEYHSVIFSSGTKVLIIEGPEVDESRILVPLVKDTICSTLFTADWMFKK